MLDFADLPYEFVPPKPNRLVITLAQMVNRLRALPGKNHRLAGIELRGAELIANVRREVPGARLVLMPNHSTHSDPQVMTEVCRRLGLRPTFMAAYDVFARSKCVSWIMQRCGAFSVDREGSDRKSMKCATDILTAGKYPLVLFPEGNVYLCNDRVTPFAEGAAYIALRAQKALGESGAVFAVPVSIKFSYVEDVREAVLAELHRIGEMFGTGLDRDAELLEELRRISITALARFLRQRGYLPPDSDLPVDEQLTTAVEQIVSSLERKMELPSRSADELVTRVRKVRAAVHAVRTSPDRQVDHSAATHWADEAMLALRILGYQGGYAASNPSLDRVSELVARLREDVTSTLDPPFGERRCVVQIGEPINLRSSLESFQDKARVAISELTAGCEAAVQAGLDEINSTNRELGAAAF